MTQTVDTAGATDVAEPDAESLPPEDDPTAADATASISRRELAHFQPAHLLVVLALAFNLWFLRAQRLVIVYPNDSAFHDQMVTAVTRMLSHGQNPLASWFPNLSLGSPLFVQYQSASAIITGAIGLVVGPRVAFAWSLYLLLALWPLCVYWTGRLLRWGTWQCAVAAFVAPLLVSVHNKGFEFGAFIWTGYGLWSELWAMWSIALAVGFGWRYISERRYLFGAVTMFAATIAFHYLLAYLAGLILIVLVLLKPSDLLRRAGRAAIVGGCAALATLWVTIPLLAESRWTSTNEFQVNTATTNSYGAPTILRWFVEGKLFDSGRLPIVTLLVVVGLGVCVARFRRDERARVLVAIFTLSMLLYFGKPTLGFVFNHLPGNRDLLFQRFIAGVDLSALFLAGVGTVFLCQAAVAASRRLAPATVEHLQANRRMHVVGLVAVTLILVGVLEPAWTQVRTNTEISAAWIQVQQQADASQGAQVSSLLNLVRARDDGRVYDGLPTTYGGKTFIGGAQLYNFVENTNTDAVGITGRTFSLMSNPEGWFDQDNQGDFRAFGIHYVLTPGSTKPLVKVTRLARTKDFTLWTIGSPGYFQVVDTRGSIAANADTIGPRTRRFLEGNLPDQGIYPTIAFDGQAAAAPTLAAGAHPRSAPGRVLAEHADLTHGSAVAVVHTSRRAVVLLSVSYDPGWHVTVDGHPAQTEMVAPALLGVAVGPGTHRIAFVYHGYGSYPLLLAIGFVTIVAVGVVPLVLRRRRARGRSEVAAPAA